MTLVCCYVCVCVGGGVGGRVSLSFSFLFIFFFQSSRLCDLVGLFIGCRHADNMMLFVLQIDFFFVVVW